MPSTTNDSALLRQVNDDLRADKLTGWCWSLTGGSARRYNPLAVADGAVWLSGLTDALLVRIDPATDQVVARYGPDAVGGGLVAVGQGYVWVTDPSANAVHRLPA